MNPLCEALPNAKNFVRWTFRNQSQFSTVIDVINHNPFSAMVIGLMHSYAAVLTSPGSFHLHSMLEQESIYKFLRELDKESTLMISLHSQLFQPQYCLALSRLKRELNQRPPKNSSRDFPLDQPHSTIAAANSTLYVA